LQLSEDQGVVGDPVVGSTSVESASATATAGDQASVTTASSSHDATDAKTTATQPTSTTLGATNTLAQITVTGAAVPLARYATPLWLAGGLVAAMV
jgi:hypothetical protein